MSDQPRHDDGVDDRRPPRQSNPPGRGPERPPDQPGPQGRRPGGTPPDESLPGGSGVDTEASTAGLLPDAVGLVMFVFVTGGVVALGATLGYDVADLVLLCGAGAVGAVGVRQATAHDGLRAAGGISLLWLTALVFARTAGELVVQSAALFEVPILFGVATATAALLAPFGVLGSTVRLYGHGAGRGVLGRYLRGTFVLLAIVVGLGVLALLWEAIGLSVGGLLSPSPGRGVPGLRVVIGRAFVAVVVYGLALALGVRVVQAFPGAVLVPPTGFDRVERVRAAVERVYDRARLAWVVYLVAVLGSVLLVAASRRTLAEPVRLALHLASFPPFLVAVVVVVGVLSAGLATLRLFRWGGTLAERGVAEIVVPPVVFTALVVLGSAVFETAARQTVERQLEVVFAYPARSGVYAFLTGQPAVTLLAALALAVLCSALVLSVPTVVAAQWFGDESLAGVASGVLALAVLLAAALATERGGAAVVGGVVVAAVVWELGEYATVAAGELGSETTPLPGSFDRLVSVHAVATLAVAVVGALLTLPVLVVSGGTVVPTGAATLVVAVASLGIVSLTALLIG